VKRQEEEYEEKQHETEIKQKVNNRTRRENKQIKQE
jgi:hypothetical protein